MVLWQRIKDLYKKISVSAKQTTTSTADGGTNVITFTFGDGTSTTFSVKNGSKGSDGAKGATGAKGEKGDRGPVGETGPQGNSGIADASSKALINDAVTGGETSYLSAEVGKLGILTYDCSKGGTVEHASLQDAINAVPSTFRKTGISIIFKSGDSIYRYALKSNSWSSDSANWLSVEEKVSELLKDNIQLCQNTDVHKNFAFDSDISELKGVYFDIVGTQGSIPDGDYYLGFIGINYQNDGKIRLYITNSSFFNYIDDENIIARFIGDINSYKGIRIVDIETPTSASQHFHVFVKVDFTGLSKFKSPSLITDKLKLNLKDAVSLKVNSLFYDNLGYINKYIKQLNICDIQISNMDPDDTYYFSYVGKGTDNIVRFYLFSFKKGFISSFYINYSDIPESDKRLKYIRLTPINNSGIEANVLLDFGKLAEFEDKTEALGILNNAYIIKNDANTFYKKNRLTGSACVTFGDSITWYDGNEYNWGKEANKMCIGFQTYMREIGMIVGNQGISGATLPEIVKDAILKYPSFANIEYVTIMSGANDTRKNIPVGQLKEIGETYDDTTYIGAYQKAIDFILGINPRIKICLFTPIKGWIYAPLGFDPQQQKDKMVDIIYADATKKVGEKYGIPVLDLYSMCGINLKTREIMMNDPEPPENTYYSLHPSNYGYKRLADLIIPFLSNI